MVSETPKKMMSSYRKRTDHFGIDNVQVSEVNQYLPHTLVKNDRIDFLEELSNDFAFVVLDDQDLAISHDKSANSTGVRGQKGK